MVNNIKTFEERLQELVEAGKKEGFLTYEQIAKKTIDLEVLKEAIYDPGTEYLFKQKILYIDDKEVRIELGLEEPDSEEEYILTDKQNSEYIHKNCILLCLTTYNIDKNI